MRPGWNRRASPLPRLRRRSPTVASASPSSVDQSRGPHPHCRHPDGPSAPQFIREGSGSASSQLMISSAPRIGSTTASANAAKYADILVYLSAPQPGCYEINARLGEYVGTYTVYLYN